MKHDDCLYQRLLGCCPASEYVFEGLQSYSLDPSLLVCLYNGRSSKSHCGRWHPWNLFIGPLGMVWRACGFEDAVCYSLDASLLIWLSTGTATHAVLLVLFFTFQVTFTVLSHDLIASCVPSPTSGVSLLICGIYLLPCGAEIWMVVNQNIGKQYLKECLSYTLLVSRRALLGMWPLDTHRQETTFCSEAINVRRENGWHWH